MVRRVWMRNELLDPSHRSVRLGGGGSRWKRFEPSIAGGTFRCIPRVSLGPSTLSAVGTAHPALVLVKHADLCVLNVGRTA